MPDTPTLLETDAVRMMSKNTIVKKITYAACLPLMLFSLYSSQSWSYDGLAEAGNLKHRATQDQRTILTPKQAAAQAQRIHGGKVMNIRQKGGYYRIRLLNNGHMKSVKVPVQGSYQRSSKNTQRYTDR